MARYRGSATAPAIALKLIEPVCCEGCGAEIYTLFAEPVLVSYTYQCYMLCDGCRVRVLKKMGREPVPEYEVEL